MINAHMIGTPPEESEHVEWSTPDVLAEDDWTGLLGMPVAEYAEQNPHMIAWYAARQDVVAPTTTTAKK